MGSQWLPTEFLSIQGNYLLLTRSIPRQPIVRFFKFLLRLIGKISMYLYLPTVLLSKGLKKEDCLVTTETGLA